MTLADVIQDSDYRFQMRLEPGSIAQFFAPTPGHSSLLQERQRWLRTAPQTYAALRPEGVDLLEETAELAQQLAVSSAPAIARSLSQNHGWDLCLALGAWWEPDFLLLKMTPHGEIRLQGGCVCFPSWWSLEEKLGLPITSIHEPVPGLNQQIGRPIHQFLAKLKPGAAWLRSNWGLSASAELNQHPSRNLPRLTELVTAETVWLRVEHQALVALPKSGGILFGIRIEMQRLCEAQTDETFRAHLLRALTTMPEAVAAYKGLARARPALIRLLE